MKPKHLRASGTNRAKQVEAMEKARKKMAAQRKREEDRQLKQEQAKQDAVPKRIVAPNIASTFEVAKAPKVARKRATVKDRMKVILESKPRCAKEILRLNAVISKLTAMAESEKAKRLYLDEKLLAARWSMSVKHIRNLRFSGFGPKVTYFGRSVRYRLRDVQAFENANVFSSRAAKEQAGKA